MDDQVDALSDETMRLSGAGGVEGEHRRSRAAAKKSRQSGHSLWQDCYLNHRSPCYCHENWTTDVPRSRLVFAH